MTVCRECNRENELDTWYEAPRLLHLVCPRCAGDMEYSRPITMEQLGDRVLELRKAVVEINQQNAELKTLVHDSPDLSKQLRRLVREAERVRQANEQLAQVLGEMLNNLSPRWVFSASEAELPSVKKVMQRLAEEAGPGAILHVTEEEMSILQKVHRL